MSWYSIDRIADLFLPLVTTLVCAGIVFGLGAWWWLQWRDTATWQPHECEQVQGIVEQVKLTRPKAGTPYLTLSVRPAAATGDRGAVSLRDAVLVADDAATLQEAVQAAGGRVTLWLSPSKPHPQVRTERKALQMAVGDKVLHHWTRSAQLHADQRVFLRWWGAFFIVVALVLLIPVWRAWADLPRRG